MADMRDAARALAPEIAARAGEIEQARRVPADLHDRLAATGLLRMLLPKAIGGAEVSPRDYAETLEILARADASTGWCVMVSASTGIKSAFLEPEVAQALYGDPKAVHGGVFAPSGRADVDGEDFILNGTWMWASNSPNCTWLTGGAVVHVDGVAQSLANGIPDARQTLFPASEATLGDDWHVSGLAGTGSGSMTVKDLRIPRRHSVSLVTDRQRTGGPLFVFPSFGLLAVGIAAVALGNARAAIDDLVSLAGGKTPQGTRRALAQRAHAQIAMAKADARLRSARAYLSDSIETAWEEARRDGAISIEARCHVRLACTHATHAAADVCRRMYELGGGSSLFLSSPLQRRFRDAYAATQHMMVAPPTLELTGRILMGLETDVTFL